MPASRRWPHKRNVQFSDEQWSALHERAEAQKTSFAAIVRELIDLGITAKAAQEPCLHCPVHCGKHDGVQST